MKSTDKDCRPETLIEFPCDYKFKAMGKASTDLIDICFKIALKYDKKVTKDNIELKKSRGNKFVSVTISVYVTCIEQVYGIYADLKKHSEVLMTL
jgi:putative lipoic acid-binding regulatory protein